MLLEGEISEAGEGPAQGYLCDVDRYGDHDGGLPDAVAVYLLQVLFQHERHDLGAPGLGGGLDHGQQEVEVGDNAKPRRTLHGSRPPHDLDVLLVLEDAGFEPGPGGKACRAGVGAGRQGRGWRILPIFVAGQQHFLLLGHKSAL